VNPLDARRKCDGTFKIYAPAINLYGDKMSHYKELLNFLDGVEIYSLNGQKIITMCKVVDVFIRIQ